MRETFRRMQATTFVRKAMGCLLLAGLPIFLNGCVSDILQKYRPQGASAKSGLNSRKGGAPAARPGIAAVDQSTFRVAKAYDRVWDALLDVLLRNYNLEIADRANGLITTEWDSYYLDGKVHRNKVSLRLRRLGGGGSSELMVYNNVEVLSKIPEGITEIWLPTDRSKAEVIRILQNTALALNLAAPEISMDPVAGVSPVQAPDAARGKL